jgi:hypothetical protein
MAKSFRVTGGASAMFKEYASFCVQWMLLPQSSYAVTNARSSIIIAEWEIRALDRAAITSEAQRSGSRPVSRDPVKGKAAALPEPEPIWEIGKHSGSGNK